MGSSEVDWEKEGARLEGLKVFRKFFEKWYGFKTPRGAETFWSIGWENGYERGKENKE